jgi:hypothetical protein
MVNLPLGNRIRFGEGGDELAGVWNLPSRGGRPLEGVPAIRPDGRRDYGETRLIATGELAGRLNRGGDAALDAAMEVRGVALE